MIYVVIPHPVLRPVAIYLVKADADQHARTICGGVTALRCPELDRIADQLDAARHPAQGSDPIAKLLRGES